MSPFANKAQVCLPPASIEMMLLLNDVAKIGVEEPEVFPLPNCPSKFPPQQ